MPAGNGFTLLNEIYAMHSPTTRILFAWTLVVYSEIPFSKNSYHSIQNKNGIKSLYGIKIIFISLPPLSHLDFEINYPPGASETIPP